MTDMPSFNRRLTQVQQETGSLLCVGLDPDLDRIPSHLPRDARGVREFCVEIVRATHSAVCAYKLNSAFFEVLGAAGFDILRELRSAIPAPVLTIYDVKRGDIGNTAKHYARAAFRELQMDAVTVNPYMGIDAVDPFVADPSLGAFLLCYTSNPGSEDFQQMTDRDGIPLFLRVAQKATEWNTNDNIGLVVGATKAEQLARIRGSAPDLPILAPGIGAQGGDLPSVLASGLNSHGAGLIIPVSRGIIFAGSGEDYADAAARAAQDLNTQIREGLSA